MTEREPSVASLLSGIVGDAQTLVRQEIALARQEIRQEISTAKDAGISLGSAALVLVIGGLLLVLALAQGLAYLLNWPTWAGYGLVGVVLAITGIILLVAARKRVQAIRPIPEQTVETIKENVAWIKERTTSDRV
jgi:uncharacterized membrane protein